MLNRKLSLVEKIILIGVIAFGIFIIGFSFWMKRSDKDFYIPQGFSGWVTIYYAVPGAKPLAKKEGVYQLIIPASGKLETSTIFEDGWSKDRFFRYDSLNNQSEIPRTVKDKTGTKKWMHWYESHFRSFNYVIPALKNGQDTLLYEGTRIYKQDEKNIQYAQGQKSLEAFYMSPQPEPMLFNPPPLADSLIFIPKLKKMLTNSKK